MLSAVLCAYFNFFQLTVKRLFLYLLYAQTFYLVRWLNVDITRALQAPSAASSSDLSGSLRHSCLVEENISALPSTPGHPDLYTQTCTNTPTCDASLKENTLYIYLYTSKLSVPADPVSFASVLSSG